MQIARRSVSIFFIILLLTSCGGCSKCDRGAPAKGPLYRCFFTSPPVQVDGNLDDAAWQKASVLKFFVAGTDRKPVSATEGKLAWDNKYLYVAFKAYDKDIWGYFTERDAVTCWEDVLEIFIKPDEEKPSYYNFEINAIGAVYDAFNVKRRAGGGDGHRWSRWNCNGLKVKIKTAGTLNNLDDEDQYWQMEVAIPFGELPSLEGKLPELGDIWLFHLARYDYSVYLPDGVELSSCAALSKVDFHFYEDWMKLKFIGRVF